MWYRLAYDKWLKFVMPLVGIILVLTMLALTITKKN